MTAAMKRTISIALATAALLVGIPRPATAQAATIQEHPSDGDAVEPAEPKSVPLPIGLGRGEAAGGGGGCGGHEVPRAEKPPTSASAGEGLPAIPENLPVNPDAPAAAEIQQIPPVVPEPQPAAAVQQSVPEAPARPKRLPLFGVMVDVGVPDGLIGSLTIRPRKWVRFSGGGGSNGVSSGWRAGFTLLPFGAGPSASFEYGGYQDGDANALAKTFGFGSSPVLQRVGYQYMNAHLGLDFGTRRFVFFLHGGVTMLRGQIHNLDALIPSSPAGDASATGTTEVTVRRDPNAKAIGPSLKLGLIVYVW